MGADEGGFDKARLGGEVAGEADGTHAATIFGEGEVRSEVVDRGGGGEIHVIVEVEELFVERRVVGEDVGGVVIDFETVHDGLDDDGGAGGVANHPMEFGGRETFAEG